MKKMSGKYQKRCYYAENKHCDRSDCPYVHPNDPAWDIVPSFKRYPGYSRRPPSPQHRRDYRRRSYSPSSSKISRSGELSRRTHGSDYDRSSRREKSRERSRSPVRFKATPKDEPSSPGPSLASRISSVSTTPIRKPSMSSTNPDLSLRLSTPSTKPAESKPQAPAMMAPPLEPSPIVSPPPPPQPRMPAPVVPLPPPPPLPEPPSLMTGGESVTPHPTAEEQRILWMTRIRLIADCVQARQQFARAEEELNTFRRLMDNPRVPTMNDDDSQRYKVRLSDLEKKHDVAKKKLKDTIGKLIAESNSWPIHPRLDDGVEAERTREMIKSFEQLKSTAQEMAKVLAELRPHDDHNEDETGSRMEVDGDAATRPLKRRRLSTTAISPTESDRLTEEEFEKLSERVTNTENIMRDVENDLNVRVADIRREIDEYMTDKVQELSAIKATIPPETETDHYQLMEGHVSEMDTELRELAKEVAGLLLKTDETSSKSENLRAVIAQDRRDMALIHEKLKEHAEERQKTGEAIEALKAALNAYINHPPSPPHSPILPSRTLILHAMEDSLNDMVRAAIQPHVEALHSEIGQRAQIHNKETYDLLWSKLSLTLRTVEALYRRLATDPAT